MQNVQLAHFFLASNCDHSCCECAQLHSVHVGVQAFSAHVLVLAGLLDLHLERVAASVATQLRFTVRLLQTVARGPWPHVWTWKRRMQREERRHVAAEVWMAAGGRGHWIKTPIRVTGGCGMEGGSCWGRRVACWTGGGPHRPFIYFDPRAAGGPGRAHAKLPRRAEPPQPPSHLSARPSVSGQIYGRLWQGCIGGGDTALF